VPFWGNDSGVGPVIVREVVWDLGAQGAPMRTFVCSAVAVLCVVGLVLAKEEMSVSVKKIEGGTMTYTKKVKKGEEAKEMTIKVSDKVKVVKGTFNKDTKKVEAGDAIEGGLKADALAKAFNATIVIDKEEVIEIRVTGKKKKAAGN